MIVPEEARQKAPDAEEDAISIATVFAAATAGDADALKAALSSDPGAASYQDPTTGRSALFAAAEADSVECVALLLEAGAPWNATDRQGSCAGDAAVAKGCSDAAGALLEAGVRAELVLGAIAEASSSSSSYSSSSSAAAAHTLPAAEEGRPYLTQRATFHASSSNGERTLSDEQGRAVMMEWEDGIMKATAHAVAKGARKGEDGSGGGVVLNVGHGLGLVDSAIATYAPRKHVICEPHPDVLARMKETGWLDREGVVVVPKRWQEASSDGDLERLGPFDGVFYDPFDDGEIDGFLKALSKLLSKKNTSVASFFNGLCSDNAFFHSVACEVVRRKLSSSGLDCDFVPLPLPASATSAETWGGVTNRYWQLEVYNLPVITWREEEEEEEMKE